jgi:hypothetical protein
MSTTLEKVARWRELYEALKECDEAAAELKRLVTAVKQEIMEDFGAVGQKGASYPGIGTVTVTERTYVATDDVETALRTMYAELGKALGDGTPLGNALLFQNRPSQKMLLDLAADAVRRRGEAVDHNSINAELMGMGFRAGVTHDLHFAAERGGNAA